MNWRATDVGVPGAGWPLAKERNEKGSEKTTGFRATRNLQTGKISVFATKKFVKTL